MSPPLLFLQPSIPVELPAYPVADTPWVTGGEFHVEIPEWTNVLGLVAADDGPPVLITALRDLLPQQELVTRPLLPVDPALVTALEGYLTEVHDPARMFGVELPDWEHYISYHSVQQLLKSLLRSLRLAAGSGGYRSGLVL